MDIDEPANVETKTICDPWSQGIVGRRSDGMRCNTCISFCAKKYPVGRCRKHAPTLNGYPVVFENDWCGDHRLDEEKI